MNADNDDEADYVAKNIVFDHDAILLDEPGAATPEQGVGMLLVNKAKSLAGDKIDVMNCDLDDDEVKASGQSISRLIESVINKTLGALDPSKPKQKKSKKAQNGYGDMSMADMMKKMRSMMDMENADMNEMRGMMDKMMSMDMENGDMRGMMQAAMEKMAKEVMPEMMKSMMADYQSNTAKAKLVEQVVNADILKRDVAEKAPVEVLEAMLEKHNPNWAAPIVGNFQPAKKPTYELPEN